MLYPFAPWEGNAAHFVNVIGATMGPMFGIIMVDYYLIPKGKINVAALYQEEGEYRYTNGWNVNAVIAAAIGAVFSTILPNFTNLLPSWWGVYGWFFGVAIGGAVYYALVKARGAPVTRTARAGGIGGGPETSPQPAFLAYVQALLDNCPPSGRERMRLPLAAKIAFMSAGATGGTPGSPTPPICMS